MSPLPAGDPRIEHFLLGRSRAEGVFQDFTGRIRRRFGVRLDGRLDNGALVLTEDFLFDDGETEQRVWRIAPEGAAHDVASADDMIGDARGRVHGGVLRWSYLFSLKLGARRLRVRFHDTFVQLSDDALLNVARVTKFGFELGAARSSSAASPEREDAAEACALTASDWFNQILLFRVRPQVGDHVSALLRIA